MHGRIQEQYPIYLLRDAKFSEKLVQWVHGETLHRGVSLTMAAVREQFWVPRLRSLVKLVRSRCYGCKRFRAIAMTKPHLVNFPEERTTVGGAFEVVGTDFAGPIRYKRKQKKEGKAYLAILACSLSRAVHLESRTSDRTPGETTYHLFGQWRDICQSGDVAFTIMQG